MSESVKHDCGVAVCVTGTILSVVMGLTVETVSACLKAWNMTVAWLYV